MKRFLALLCALPLLLLASPVRAAFGTPYDLGAKVQTGTGTTAILTVTNNVAPGDRIVVWAHQPTSTTTIDSVTDSVGSVYSVSTTSLSWTGARMRMFSAIAAGPMTAGVGTITGTFSSSAHNRYVYAAAYSTGADAVDLNLTGASVTASSISQAFTGQTHAPEMLWAAVYLGGTLSTPPAGWTQMPTANALWYKSVSANETATWTLTGSATSATQGLSFYEVPTSTCRGALTMMGVGGC